MNSGTIESEVVTTKIPARLDRLPWTRWHWMVILALGTVWVLDGLEVTIKGAVGPSLKDSIGFSSVQVAGSASIYIFGAITGALVWGYLTDRYGRRRLFMITLGTYMLGVAVTSLAGVWVGGGATFYWFAVGRFITGFGIGGEYSAINSAIDELIPARARGFADLAINGSYWLGTIVGAGLGYVYLVTLPSDVGWRVAFAMGGTLAVGILLLRLMVPESPRWLITHGQTEEAERIVDEIEDDVSGYADEDLEEPGDDDAIEIRERESVGFLTIGRTLFGVYPKRSLVGFSLMTAQAFLYNSVFFTYGIALTTFYGVSATKIGLYLIPFAAGNFLGPLLMGPLFDSIGRRPMIAGNFILSGVLTAIMAWQFAVHNLTPVWHTLALVVIFFFASAGASAGYLTISETFPLEIRAMAIAFFYALSTGLGGIIGPYAFGRLIATKDFWLLAYGFWAVAALMIAAGIVHATLGVAAEKRSLEDVAQPLSAEEAEAGEHRGEQPDEDEEAADADEPTARERDEVEHVEPRPFRRRSAYSGLPLAASVPPYDRDVDREAAVIAEALREHGAMSSAELHRHVGARYWGPGRFRRALRLAQTSGDVRREGRGRYAPAQTVGAGGS